MNKIGGFLSVEEGVLLSVEEGVLLSVEEGVLHAYMCPDVYILVYIWFRVILRAVNKID